LPGNDRLAPGVIKAVQTIAETEPVGTDKAQGRIIDQETSLRRRNTDRPLKGNGIAIDQDTLYPGCGRQQLMICAVWMHYGEANVQRKPDVSMQIFRHRSVALHAFCSTQAIRKTVDADICIAWMAFYHRIFVGS
jgi:hypothetical protein